MSGERRRGPAFCATAEHGSRSPHDERCEGKAEDEQQLLHRASNRRGRMRPHASSRVLRLKLRASTLGNKAGRCAVLDVARWRIHFQGG